MHYLMKFTLVTFAVAVVLGSLTLLPSRAQEAAEPAVATITLYCGRSAALVEPLVKRFTEETGIRVELRAADTAQLALALTEEGNRSPADVFWSQDSGTLGQLASRGFLDKLPATTLDRVPEAYRSDEGSWVATSGRLRVLAYSPQRVKEADLPKSVFDLTDAKYKGRVGWAPTNASFQAFITAMVAMHGEEKTRQWLLDMKANQAKPFPKNTALVAGIANGEIDLSLPNHYYLLRFKSADARYPVEQTQFEKGDIGNMNNLSGVGLLKTSKNKDAALKLIDFLLSSEAQQYFVEQTFEMPVTRDRIATPAAMPDLHEALDKLPAVNLNKVEDLEGTQKLLREAGLI